MPASPFRAEIQGEVARVTIALCGDVNVLAEPGLQAAYADAAARGATTIVADFARTDYINSTGIALIVRLLADARRDGRKVIAVGLSPHYAEIFRITRLSDYMHIEEPSSAAAHPGAAPAEGGPR